MFAIGVGVGSLLCERLSGRQVEIGLVPFGSIGLTLFAVDWVIATPRVDSQVLLTARTLLQLPGGVRTLFDIAAIGVFGGFFRRAAECTGCSNVRVPRHSRVSSAPTAF